MTVLITFIQKAIMQGVCMLFGADGEILTEKSGNLNLGVPGMMYMGGIAGLIAAFYYEKAARTSKWSGWNDSVPVSCIFNGCIRWFDF